MSESLPFEQQADESAQAFAAFACYRDMQSDRSIDLVGQKLGKSSALIGRWSNRHNWVARARSYDAALDARIRHATEQDAIKERREMLRGHAEEARRLRSMNKRILDEFDRRFGEKGTLQWISGEDFIKVLAQVSKNMQMSHQLERLAMGEPAENVDPPKPFGDMTPDELQDYVTRLRAVLKD